MTLGKQQHDLFHTITFYCIHCYLSVKRGEKIPTEIFSFFDRTSVLSLVCDMKNISHLEPNCSWKGHSHCGRVNEMFNSNRISVTVAVVLKVTCVFFSLKLSRVWFSISHRLPCVKEPFQNVLSFYFRGSINWTAGFICRTLPSLHGSQRKRTGNKGECICLILYI